MSRKKNNYKQKINSCFLCGKIFKSLSEKQGHRINPRKGNTQNNLLVLCQNCKKYLQKNKELKIYNIELNKQIKEKYFENISAENRKIILQKIRDFRKRSL